MTRVLCKILLTKTEPSFLNVKTITALHTTKILIIHHIAVAGLDWTMQCFTSPPTQYRLYGRRFLLWQIFNHLAITLNNHQQNWLDRTNHQWQQHQFPHFLQELQLLRHLLHLCSSHYTSQISLLAVVATAAAAATSPGQGRGFLPLIWGKTRL